MVFETVANAATQMQQKLNQISADQLQQMLSVPAYDAVSQQLSTLLPQNLTQVDSTGNVASFNPTNLSNTVAATTQQVSPAVSNQVTGQLQAVVNSLPTKPSVINQNAFAGPLNQSLANTAQQLSTTAANQMTSLLQQNVQTSQLSNMAQAVASPLQNASFSPKMIRDMANPQMLAQQAQQFFETARDNLTQTAEQMAQTLAQNPVFANSGQVNLQQLSSPKFSGNNTQGYKVAARITSYWAQGPGTDADTAQYKSSTGRRLQQGISCAVDGSTILFGSTVDIPGVGTRLAVDTGGAVKGRVASGGRLPIVDVFFDTKQAAQAAGADRETVVTVYPPASKWAYVKNAPPTYGAA